MAQGVLYQRYAVYYQRASILYQKPQIKASLEILLSVFTVALLIFFAIRPTLTNIASLQKKIQDQDVVMKKADTKIGQLLKAEKALSENQQGIEKLRVAVPDLMVYADIMKRVEILAKENSLRLNTVRLPTMIVSGVNVEKGLPGDSLKDISKPDNKGLLKIQVSFSVLGSQKDVLNFFKALENMDRLALIEKLKIAKVEKTGKDTNAGLAADATTQFFSYELPKSVQAEVKK